MTENEIINIDECLKELKSHRDTYLKRSAPWRIVNRAIRLIEPYREIGTVEECRTAYERGYSQGAIDRAEEVQKAREYGYAKAIDEFAERMKELSDSVEISVFGWNRIIDEIAEQMKEGAE